jgi:hypothetical protein
MVYILEGCVVVVEAEFWMVDNTALFSRAFRVVALGTKHLQIILL